MRLGAKKRRPEPAEAGGAWRRNAAGWCARLVRLSVSLVAALCPAQELPPHRALSSEPESIRKQAAQELQAFLLEQNKTAVRDRAGRSGNRTVEAKRKRLAEILGTVDPRQPFAGFELCATTAHGSVLVETPRYRVHAVRWPVFDGVHGERLLLEPVSAAKANLIALPDAGWTPETFAESIPRLLADAGARVLVPVLVDRGTQFSVTRDGWGKTPPLATLIPHREVVQRMAYELGRTVTGYEVQKVLAAVDQFRRESPALPVAVMGTGEGGRIALYAAALDTRIDATWVRGSFGPRERMWEEPLDRNLWSVLLEFGDAETARLIAPRTLIVDTAEAPEYTGVPPSQVPTPGAPAPGFIRSPGPDEAAREFARAASFYEEMGAPARARLAAGDRAADAFFGALGLLRPVGVLGQVRTLRQVDGPERMKRQFEELVEHCQKLMRQSEFRRREFWARADFSSPARWAGTRQMYRDALWNEVIGRLADPSEPLEFSARLRYDEPGWKGWEISVPVWRGVSVYGVLLVPKDLKPGERHPVVVVQHGLRGAPDQIVNPRAETAYNSFGAQLAARGYIVFAPYGPHDGSDDYRVLTRMANPLGLTIYSIIVGQHQRILEWLATLPFVDSSRIGLYGLSFGGKTAIRVAAVLDGYAVSVCSGDFNDWIFKNANSVFRASTVYTHAWETPEFDLARRFNYGEMAWLIAPRPFMVERGHHDAVALDEWVAYEYAKVRRLYAVLGLPERTEIEFFNGGHAVNGKGTFEFLHKHLNWKARTPVTP